MVVNMQVPASAPAMWGSGEGNGWSIVIYFALKKTTATAASDLATAAPCVSLFHHWATGCEFALWVCVSMTEQRTYFYFILFFFLLFFFFRLFFFFFVFPLPSSLCWRPLSLSLSLPLLLSSSIRLSSMCIVLLGTTNDKLRQQFKLIGMVHEMEQFGFGQVSFFDPTYDSILCYYYSIINDLIIVRFVHVT